MLITRIINDEQISVYVYGDDGTLEEIDENIAKANGESKYQIYEGREYEFEVIDKKYSIKKSETVFPSRIKSKLNTGKICPNIYVGTLELVIINLVTSETIDKIYIEVRSIKTDYRTHYRKMLSEIAEKTIELLLQHSSPVIQQLQAIYDSDPKTDYQQFAFIKSIIDSTEFDDVIYRIVNFPVTRWVENESKKDIKSIKRVTGKISKQFSNSKNRIPFSVEAGLPYSLPRIISTYNKEETTDTPENRFIKHALEHFRDFIGKVRIKAPDKSRLKSEAEELENKLNEILDYSFFKEITNPNTLLLNSPVLQRKEGYREILKTWLMFDLAAKLNWEGGEDIYGARKKNIAVLYEYWVFFELFKIMSTLFNIKTESIDKLIGFTSDQLGLKLKQGISVCLDGFYNKGSRNLSIRFSYNRSFKGSSNFPEGGSWTKTLRPDYSISIWPEGIDIEEAEKKELIIHIHFDAKYKIDKPEDIFDLQNIENTDEEEALSIEKQQQNEGNYKRADLLKMHAYKDAIRRTGGAYVLYPGRLDAKYYRKGFHEIIPGLGAFALNPSHANEGSAEISKFILDVISQIENRASQWDKTAFRIYDIHKESKSTKINELLPELIDKNRDLLPDETFVLIGFYKSNEHLEWIQKYKLYNTRTGSANGSLHLTSKEADSKYLLLHTNNESISNKLFRLSDKGPRLFSKSDMLKINYPNPSQDFYLVYDIDGAPEEEFKNLQWNITKLEAYKKGSQSAWPFSVSLSELMKKEIITS